MEDILIPITLFTFAIGLPVSIPLVRTVLNYRRRRQLIDLHHAERMAAIERGMELPPLPPQLFEGDAPRRRRSSLLPGLVWLFVGGAILISMRSLVDEGALLGLIPVGVGLAYLVYYFVEGRSVERRLLDRDLEMRSAGHASGTSSPPLR